MSPPSVGKETARMGTGGEEVFLKKGRTDHLLRLLPGKGDKGDDAISSRARKNSKDLCVSRVRKKKAGKKGGAARFFKQTKRKDVVFH